MLDDWRPEVDAIVVVESVTRPTLTDDLADGLSRLAAGAGRRPLGDRRPRRRARPGRDELRPAGGRRRPPRRRCRPTYLPGARVLLVDDQVVTGWTLTLAARAIRAAGAAAVLPLTLAVQS